ncbi:MAG: flagellar hook-length control protein FliK [Devosia sp.]
MRPESALSPHLAISYASPTPASSTAAGAVGDAAGGTSPGAGFLAALIDQLLAGAGATASTTTAAADSSDPAASLGAILDAGLKVQAQSPDGGTPVASLLATLTQQLSALKDQLDAGETPDAGTLKKLGDTLDALAALIASPAPAATPAVDAATLLDPLAAIGKAGATPAIAPQTAASILPQQPVATDQSVSLFAGLIDGDGVPASVPATTAPPLAPALAELAKTLTSLSQAVVAASPEVSRKLEALGQKLDATANDPQLLAQLDPQAKTGSSLDTIVRSLLPQNPAPAAGQPQLASTATLAIPAVVSTSSGRADDGSAPPDDGSAPTKVSLSSAAPVALNSTTPKPDDGLPKPKTDATEPAARVADASALGAQPATSQASTPARALPAAYQAAQNPINMGQLAFEMVRQVQQGQSRFSIRLDPPELGRIDVKLHVDAAGTVNAKLTVERAETLDMFQRDRGTLERALSQAGLDSGKTNLEFSLRQNPFANMGGDRRQSGSGAAPHFAASGDDDPVAQPSVTLYRGLASAGGVNLFV